ncbi:hypothetical protein PVL29_008042 [Vitis rotundifolia]|uniref:ABC transporter domain-containing protein n=1 Tax=Vitis rotundifolia TaxID=103349 RepID=A0AA39DX31_VITRO|nr:hypothetical protein PVL29_008042 [Vitis rotundifolia]
MEIEMEGGDGGGGSGGRDVGVVAYLVWEDLTVVVPSFGSGATRRVLHGLSGYAEPGRFMAVMGPSGSGKSTLLDSLAGRLSRNVILSGNVVLNGKRRSLDHGGVAYVTQEDVLLGTLTVKETLTYAAQLRLPTTMTKQKVNSIVEETITEMGLEHCADQLIGNWHLRGISSGEKKRLSIALEILTQPHLLLLDEPTSGLDNASAFFITQTLKNAAFNGRTVISSIHQPSSEVFALLDDLLLLSNGETVYFGEAKMALQFFAEAGFPCPSRRNPSDHFLHCTNSSFDTEPEQLSDSLMNLGAEEIKATLIEKYNCSKYATKTRSRIREISNTHELVTERKGGSKARRWVQLLTLVRRSFVNMSRDWGYYRIRVLAYILLALSVGTVFYDIGTTTSFTALLARVNCGGYVMGFLTLLSIGGFPSFIEEVKVFSHERTQGHYGNAVFVLSNFLSSFPFLVGISVSSITIIFYMGEIGSDFSHYAYLCLVLFGCIAAVESSMMLVASLVPNYKMGILVGCGFIGVMMLASGYYRKQDDMPKPFLRYPISYISFMAWTFKGLYKSLLMGLEFDPLIPGDPKLKGEFFLRTMLGISLSHSKWWDLAAVLAIAISYRLLFLAVLKLKEQGSPLLLTLYTKKILQLLRNRQKPCLSSERHHPPYSLSSQEGFSSPIV